MLIENIQVFDDYVCPNGEFAFTSDEWNARLGRCSAIAVMAYVDDVGPSGTGTFDLFLIHSADNRNWWLRTYQVAAVGGGAGVGYGDITSTSLAAGGQLVGMYSDGCRRWSITGSTATGPLLPFVRFSMITTVVRARVRLYAACRGPSRW